MVLSGDKNDSVKRWPVKPFSTRDEFAGKFPIWCYTPGTMNADAIHYAAERAEFLAPFNPNHRHDFHLLVRSRDNFELGYFRSSASYADILPAVEAVLQKLKSGLPRYRRAACPACGRRHPFPRIKVCYCVMTDSGVVFERHCDALSIRHAIGRPYRNPV